MALNGIELSSGIVLTAGTSIDKKYGPYADLATAKSQVTSGYRYKGLTVGVYINNILVEYWWKNGVSDGDLIEKNSVLEYASQGNRPATGEIGKIYVTLDDNKCWRWNATTSAYVEVSASTGTIASINNLQETLNGKQTTFFKEGTIAATQNGQTLSVDSYYTSSNGADLRRTLNTVTFTGVTGGTTIIRLPQWLSTGLGAWRGDQAFFKFPSIPAGVTLKFQYATVAIANNVSTTTWVDLPSFTSTSPSTSTAFQATIETGTHVVWEHFPTLYGIPVSAYLDTTTAQTVGGVKTFSATPVFNNGIDLANKTMIKAVPDIVTYSGNALTLTDAGHNGRVIYMNNTTGATVSVPTGLSKGFNCTIIQGTTSGVTVQAGSGATLNAYQSLKTLAGQFAAVSVLATDTNTYIIYGNTI